MKSFLDISNTGVRVLAIYRKWFEQGKGCPTYSEVAADLGVTSAAVLKHVEVLQEKGYVQRRAGHVRNIVLTDKAL